MKSTDSTDDASHSIACVCPGCGGAFTGRPHKRFCDPRCSRSYHQRSRMALLGDIVRDCAFCQTTFRVERTGGSGGNNRRYCTEACVTGAMRSRRGTVERPKNVYVPAITIRRCQVKGCAETWQKVGRRGPNKWCDDHRKAIAAEYNRENRAREARICGADGCVRRLLAKGLCRGHYSKKLRAEGRMKPDPWNDRRRDNYHARRARMAGARNGDRAMLADIVDRDGTSCAWCDEVVDMALAWPDPMSKSIDHTLPISRGGEHSLANTRLMHLGCNSSKGARAA